MGAKPPTQLRLFAERFTEVTGLEFTFTSADYSAFDLEIKRSPLLRFLTFGYVLGLAIDVWANGDELLNLRVKVAVRKKR